MYTPNIIASFLAMAVLSQCVALPATEPLIERDTCYIAGWMSNAATTSFGDKGLASRIVKGGLKLECTNGKGWKLGENKVPLRAQTISSKDSGLPQDVQWRQNRKTGGYKGCSRRLTVRVNLRRALWVVRRFRLVLRMRLWIVSVGLSLLFSRGIRRYARVRKPGTQAEVNCCSVNGFSRSWISFVLPVFTLL